MEPMIDTRRSSIPPAPFALVLSGGGARGFVHVGVLRALEARGLRPAAGRGRVHGTSSRRRMPSGTIGTRPCLPWRPARSPAPSGPWVAASSVCPRGRGGSRLRAGDAGHVLRLGRRYPRAVCRSAAAAQVDARPESRRWPDPRRRLRHRSPDRRSGGLPVRKRLRRRLCQLRSGRCPSAIAARRAASGRRRVRRHCANRRRSVFRFSHRGRGEAGQPRAQSEIRTGSRP